MKPFTIRFVEGRTTHHFELDNINATSLTCSRHQIVYDLNDHRHHRINASGVFEFTSGYECLRNLLSNLILENPLSVLFSLAGD